MKRRIYTCSLLAFTAIALSQTGCGQHTHNRISKADYEPNTPSAFVAASWIDIAATSLSSLETAADIIAHNIANTHTIGYRARRVVMEELASGENWIGNYTSPFTAYVGRGVRIAGVEVDWRQGAPIQTDRPLDLMIDGQGFFQIQVAENIGGGTAYTRAGNFTVNADGELVSCYGERLEPSITVPSDRTNISIAPDGRVFVLIPGSIHSMEVGQLQIASFVNPDGLKPVGNGSWVETEASGSPITGYPSNDQFGRVRAGLLETSNVSPAAAQVELLRVVRHMEIWNTILTMTIQESSPNVRAMPVPSPIEYDKQRTVRVTAIQPINTPR